MSRVLFGQRRSMIIVALLIAVLLRPGFAGEQDKYSKIRVRVTDKSELARLNELGVQIERRGKIGKDGLECVARGQVLDRLRAEGIPFDVVVEDLEKFYADRLTAGPVNALGFGLGSMGGYYTLSEIRQQLDSMRAVHPEVVGLRDSIGASFQGRPLWAVRMTENPDVPSVRPQVFYFAMQHACEPQGMMTVLYFMWYLAEHYGIDPEVTYLLQHRDLWFVPIVNVDGYEANRRNNPSGGGGRRKSMHGVSYDWQPYGVDLNRNWDAEWGYDNVGSSSNPADDTYRGTGPFSEPETQVLRDFFKGKSFRLVMEYHSAGNYIVCPPLYIYAETRDSLLFRAYIRELIRDNRYSSGMTTTGGGGLTNGDATDWFYENPPAPGPSYPFIVEVGSYNDGDWPPTSRIQPIAQENLTANLFAAWAGGALAKVQDAWIADSSGDGNLMPGEAFSVLMRVRNFGQDLTTSTTISAASTSLQVSATPISVPGLLPRADTMITIPGRVSPGARGGGQAEIVVTIKPGGVVEDYDTVRCVIGGSTVLLADGAEEELTKWSFWGGWGKTTVSHSGNWAFTDSPNGKYFANANAGMTLLSPVHIPEADGKTFLRFWTRWDVVLGVDYGQVWVSSDGGSTWSSVYGELSRFNLVFGYTGGQQDWVEEQVDLTALTGRDILIRFTFTSDASGTADGWYVDDISIRSYPLVGVAYAYNVNMIRQDVDTLRITARVENSLSHKVGVAAFLRNGSGALIDSMWLKDDGLHGDSTAKDGLWGYGYVPQQDNTIRLTLRTDDSTEGLSRSLPDIAQHLFSRKPIITVDTRSIDFGVVDNTVLRLDSTFMVWNGGWAPDSVKIKLDRGTFRTSAALGISDTLFEIAPFDSHSVTISVQPPLVDPGSYLGSVKITSKFGYGDTSFVKNFLLRKVVTGIAGASALPREFALGANYPNPFNPSTTIRYELPERSHVTLTVLNTLGQKVATLVDGEMEAGYQEVQFDASRLASGVYVYRLAAGAQALARKLILLR
jgi:carboxypeptidase T